jgi:phosphomannomutase
LISEHIIKPWIEDPYFDLSTRNEVKSLLNFPQELESAFFTDLKFGTGGLRGIMGIGTARINVYTIRKATQGLASYIKKEGDPSKGVVIGFDSRHNSELFAHETARVLLGNGIPVFLCPALRPTPFISFACRHLGAAAAIMITASHNPKGYNGYKVYWSDGAQIVAPHDIGITQEIEKIISYSAVTIGELTSPLLTWIDATVDTAYLKAIASHPIFSSHQKTALKICYSSLHGTGITLLPQALQACGFSPPLLVSSQCKIDPDFPSASSPNPESPAALQEGIQLLEESKSDILFVTDPDADRLGVVILHAGTPVILNGHQLAALGAFYLCDSLSKRQLLPQKSGIITTIVTTPLIDKIAQAYNVQITRVLTGFKYIGEKIREWEEQDRFFLFGAEESLGYLIGTTCRDKDGIAAACLFAKIAADLKSQGKTLQDLLNEIYHRFGLFQEKALSLDFSSNKEGMESIHYLMQNLRNHPPTTLGSQPIIHSIDYLIDHDHSLPRADVLQWTLEDGSSLIIRPSGTEPKLKAYLSFHTSFHPTFQNNKNLEKLSFLIENHLQNLLVLQQK